MLVGAFDDGWTLSTAAEANSESKLPSDAIDQSSSPVAHVDYVVWKDCSE